VATPAGDAVLPKDLRQRQFRVLVPPRPDARHHLGTFGFSEDVSHAARQNSFIILKSQAGLHALLGEFAFPPAFLFELCKLAASAAMI
jgi:hypothetical protein